MLLIVASILYSGRKPALCGCWTAGASLLSWRSLQTCCRSSEALQVCLSASVQMSAWEALGTLGRRMPSSCEWKKPLRTRGRGSDVGVDSSTSKIARSDSRQHCSATTIIARRRSRIAGDCSGRIGARIGRSWSWYRAPFWLHV